MKSLIRPWDTLRGRPLFLDRLAGRFTRRFALPPNDLLRDRTYRRLWSSIVISSCGGQLTMLALPLTSAVLLHATPTQMGWLTTLETLPFVLFSLPFGVWLDRVRKLPVYIAGETTLALIVASVPIAWWCGWLSMAWMDVCAFALGTVYTTAGSAAQVVLTQVVPRERLVEAHAKNVLATSGAEVLGPGLAGALIKAVGAPVALLLDAALTLGSALILRGIAIDEQPRAAAGRRFGRDLLEGLRFVLRNRLLVALAFAVGVWQMCNNAAVVVQILVATRALGLSEQAVGLSYVGLGVGSVVASMLGHRLSRRIGPGPCLVLGFAICGAGWMVLAAAPAGRFGGLAFAGMLMLFAIGAVLMFINFLAMRQASTPAPLLGRMTSTMRWLILIPAAPGALLGGWIGEHVSLQATLACSGAIAWLLALGAWFTPAIRNVRVLPTPGDPTVDAGAGAAAAPELQPLVVG